MAIFNGYTLICTRCLIQTPEPDQLISPVKLLTAGKAYKVLDTSVKDSHLAVLVLNDNNQESWIYQDVHFKLFGF